MIDDIMDTLINNLPGRVLGNFKEYREQCDREIMRAAGLPPVCKVCGIALKQNLVTKLLHCPACGSWVERNQRTD